MFRVLAFLTKRDGISADDFADYYENHHVPLILRLAPLPDVYKRRYRGEALWISSPAPVGRSPQTRRGSWTALAPERSSLKSA